MEVAHHQSIIALVLPLDLNNHGKRYSHLSARVGGCCRLPTGRSHLMGSCFSSGEMKALPRESWSSAYGQIGNSGALYEPGRPPKYRNLA